MTSKNRLLCHSGLSIFKKILFFPKMLCFILMLWSSNRIAAESFQSCLTQCDLMDCSLPGCPWDSLGKGTGVCCHALLQGIFPTQGLNPGLRHCRQILYQLSHKGSPRILEWVAYPFSNISSRPRNQTGVSSLQADSLPAELWGSPHCPHSSSVLGSMTWLPSSPNLWLFLSPFLCLLSKHILGHPSVFIMHITYTCCYGLIQHPHEEGHFTQVNWYTSGPIGRWKLNPESRFSDLYFPLVFTLTVFFIVVIVKTSCVNTPPTSTKLYMRGERHEKFSFHRRSWNGNYEENCEKSPSYTHYLSKGLG